MPNYLPVPTELSFLIEKRDSTDRRSGTEATELPKAKQTAGSRERRSGKDRRKPTNKRPDK